MLCIRKSHASKNPNAKGASEENLSQFWQNYKTRATRCGVGGGAMLLRLTTFQREQHTLHNGWVWERSCRFWCYVMNEPPQGNGDSAPIKVYDQKLFFANNSPEQRNSYLEACSYFVVENTCSDHLCVSSAICWRLNLTAC